MRQEHRGEDKLRNFFKWVRHSYLYAEKEASREGNDEDKKNKG